MVLSSVSGLAGPPMYLFPNWEAVPRGQPVVERLGGTIDISWVYTTTLNPLVNHRTVVGLKLYIFNVLSNWKSMDPQSTTVSFESSPPALFFRVKCVVFLINMSNSEPCWSGWSMPVSILSMRSFTSEYWHFTAECKFTLLLRTTNLA